MKGCDFMNDRKIFVRREYGYVGKKMHVQFVGPFNTFEEAKAYGLIDEVITERPDSKK